MRRTFYSSIGVKLLAAALLLGGAVAAGCRDGGGSPVQPVQSSHHEAQQAPAARQQSVCPVMGGKVDRAIYVDYDGKRVYFCCSGCPGTFKSDPARYVKQMEEQGIALEPSPVGREPHAPPT